MTELWDAFLEDYEKNLPDWSLCTMLKAFWYYCQDGTKTCDKFLLFNLLGKEYNCDSKKA